MTPGGSSHVGRATRAPAWPRLPVFPACIGSRDASVGRVAKRRPRDAGRVRRGRVEDQPVPAPSRGTGAHV